LIAKVRHRRGDELSEATSDGDGDPAYRLRHRPVSDGDGAADDADGADANAGFRFGKSERRVWLSG
jgi:hypothetical protein